MRIGTRLFVSTILMTVSLLVVVPFGLRLVATRNQRFFHVSDGYEIFNFLVPMGFASFALICAGLVVTWTGFKVGQRSAWFILLIFAWLFYFPVLVLPFYPTDWLARLENAKTSAIERELLIHFFGFLIMLVALLLPVKDFFWRRATDANRPVPTNQGLTS